MRWVEKKRLLLGAGLVFLSLALALVLAYEVWYRGSLHFRYDQIQKGMTKQQVEEVLGCPEGGYATEGHIFMASVAPPRSPYADYWFWMFNEGNIHVYHDAQGLVVAKRIALPPPRNHMEGLLQERLLYPLDERD
jgi:hypothetical protein